MRPLRYTSSQYEKRLTVKVIVVSVCLDIFTKPQFIGITFAFYFHVKSPNIKKKNIVYFKTIVLYANKFVNVIILVIDFHRPKNINYHNVVSYF